MILLFWGFKITTPVRFIIIEQVKIKVYFLKTPCSLWVQRYYTMP
jgi:hypothetical protein